MSPGCLHTASATVTSPSYACPNGAGMVGYPLDGPSDGQVRHHLREDSNAPVRTRAWAAGLSEVQGTLQPGDRASPKGN